MAVSTLRYHSERCFTTCTCLVLVVIVLTILVSSQINSHRLQNVQREEWTSRSALLAVTELCENASYNNVSKPGLRDDGTLAVDKNEGTSWAQFEHSVLPVINVTETQGEKQRDELKYPEVSAENDSTRVFELLEQDASLERKEKGYRVPDGERKVRRFPQCVLIGFSKCGTRALLNYMAMHPFVAIVNEEVNFYNFDELFQQGYNWYLSLQPPTYRAMNPLRCYKGNGCNTFTFFVLTVIIFVIYVALKMNLSKLPDGQSGKWPFRTARRGMEPQENVSDLEILGMLFYRPGKGKVDSQSNPIGTVDQSKAPEHLKEDSTLFQSTTNERSVSLNGAISASENNFSLEFSNKGEKITNHSPPMAKEKDNDMKDEKVASVLNDMSQAQGRGHTYLQIASGNSGTKIQKMLKQEASLERAQQLYKAPKGEKMMRRFPGCIVIGFSKCGTRALLSFMDMHPYVACAGPELSFYNVDEFFRLGYNWYLSKQPLTYSNQVTVEKTPGYVKSERALREIQTNFPDTKLIAIMKDPVERLVGQYMQSNRFNLDSPSPLHMFYRHRDGLFSPDVSSVDMGVYHKHLSPWLETFPRDQLLFLDGHQLIHDPLTVVKKVETFLGIPPLFKTSNFVFNATKGFFCRRLFGESKIICLSNEKGFTHPQLPPEDEKMLRNFYAPHNLRLYKMIGETFSW